VIDPDDEDDLDEIEVEPDDPDEWRDYCDDPYGDECDADA
jgi:hypothetical protein